MKDNYNQFLNTLKEDTRRARTKEDFMKLFRSAVILETKCINSDDEEIREIGYKAQGLQRELESKI